MREINGMLERVVSPEGTARRAVVPMYRVAGKTGTVRKLGPQGYLKGRYLSLFSGFGPMSDPRYVGTALTMQTSLGFLLTLFSIRIIPPLVARFGWEWAFAILALGPLFGIWSMIRLRRLPEATKMASGNR